jgi:hypothetical protein
MRKRNFTFLLLAVLACGLIAAGCGSDDSTSSTTATETTATESTTDATTDESTTDESTTETTSSGETSPDDVYQACEDLIKGTAAETAAQPGCEQARDAFQQCQDQANAIDDSATKDQALGICQDAADKALKTLQAAG